MTEKPDPLLKLIQQYMAESLERAIAKSYAETPAAAQGALTAAMLDQMASDWAKLQRNIRRDSLTFVVDMAHQGPMIRHRHPVDGEFIECSWRQAQEVHEHVQQLTLSVVRSVESAEFRLASQFDGPQCRYLPMPPYELSPGGGPDGA